MDKISCSHQLSHWAAQPNEAGPRVRNGKKMWFESHLDEVPEVYDLFNVPGTSFHLPDT